MKSSKSETKRRGRATRYIALPQDKKQPVLFFESQKEAKDFFQIGDSKFNSVLNNGEPVCIGNVIYYIDEDLFE